MNLLQAGTAVLRVIRRNSPILISAAAGIGLILVYYLTIKETEEIVEEMQEMTEEEIHSEVMVRKVVKTFAPSFLLLVFTLFCIVQSTVISQHRIRDLTAYSASLAAYYQQYRSKNIKMDGLEQDHQIMNEIVQERVNKKPPIADPDEGYVCNLAGYSPYFYVSSLEDIWRACSICNEMYFDKGPEEISLSNWMKLANAVQYDDYGNIVPFDYKHYGNLGWSTYMVTHDESVSGLYPYISKTKEENGQDIYFIDLPIPQPLETISWKCAPFTV